MAVLRYFPRLDMDRSKSCLALHQPLRCRKGPVAVQMLESQASYLSFTTPAMSHTATAPANAEKRYTVHRSDLPLSCPTPEMALWNSHPRVYLPIEDEPNGEAKCAYCGAVFVLAD